MELPRASQYIKIFLKGSAISIAVSIAIGALNYFIRRFLALNLPERDYGFFYGSMAIVFLLSSFLELGLTQAGSILLSKKSSDSEGYRLVLSRIAWCKVVLGGVCLAGVLLFAPLIVEKILKAEDNLGQFMLLGSLVFLIALESIPLIVFSSLMDFKTRGCLQLLRALWTFVFICLFINTLDLQLLVIIVCGAYVMSSFLGFGIIRFKHGVFPSSFAGLSKGAVAEIFGKSGWIALSTAALASMYYWDTICLAWMTDLESVGLYNIALPIVQVFQSLMIFPVVFTPIASQLWEKKDFLKIKQMCIAYSGLLVIGLPFVVLGAYQWSEFIITIMFSSKFSEASTAVTILGAGMIFSSIASFNSRALNAGNYFKTTAIVALLGALLNILLNFFFVPLWGINGAALATASSHLLVSLALTINIAFRKC